MSIHTKKKGRCNTERVQYVLANPEHENKGSRRARTILHMVVNPRLVAKRLSALKKDIVYSVKVIPDNLAEVEQRKLENLKSREVQSFNYNGIVIMARNKINADRKHSNLIAN